MFPKKIYLNAEDFIDDLPEHEGVDLRVEYVFMQSVWHDAQVEEPEEDIEFLCDDDCINWCVRGWNCILPWEDYCRNNGITKWAYVRDLLPEGGER